MKQTLYAPLPYDIEYGGKRFILAPYFNRVLAVLDAQSRNDLTDQGKLDFSLFLLLQGSKKIGDKAGLLNAIFELLIEPATPKSNSKKCVDFLQDAAYIYAAFMQTYGIDLIDQQDKLHWWQFLSLFRGLPDDTRIVQIMSIRTRQIPKATQYNRDEINHLIQLKREYALEMSQEDREQQYAIGLKKIANALGGMTSAKG